MKKLVILLIQVLIAIIVLLILALVFMCAWNGIIPYIFNLSPLTYTQAACLIIITQVIATICTTKNND